MDESRKCNICNANIDDLPLSSKECKKCTEDKIKKNNNDNDNDNESNNENEEEKRVKRKKHQKKEHLATLAELVSKEYVDADEFREIVKRNAKSDEKISWTLRQEYLLKEIGEKSLCYYLLHRDESIRFKKVYDISMVQIFTQTMMASVLMFIASGFQGASEQSDNSVKYMYVLPLASGMINLGIAFQQKVLEFKQPERFMIEHETTSRVFRGIYDDIRKELLLERKDRANMPGFLDIIYERYITEKKKAPFVSKIGYQAFRRRHLSSEGEFGDIEEDNETNLKCNWNCCLNNKDNYKYNTRKNDYINKDYYGGCMIDEFTSEEEKKIKMKTLKKQIMNSMPEDIIGFKLLNINDNDIIFSEKKQQYEMEWELEYLNKKMREKLKKLDKIVRHELDEEHNSDMDSVDMEENIIIDIPKSKSDNEIITIENNKREKDILPLLSISNDKIMISKYIYEFKKTFGRYPLVAEIYIFFEKEYSISDSPQFKYDLEKLIDEIDEIDKDRLVNIDEFDVIPEKNETTNEIKKEKNDENV